MKQDPQNPASVPSVKRVQIQQLFIYDISQLDLEMLRQAALEPVTPPDTLDLTFSTFLLSVAASALFCIVGLAATGTAVKDWIYPVLGVVTLIAVIAGSYFALRYKKAVVLFETRRKGKEKEVERLLEEIKNRPLPQGQSHPRSDESGAWQQRVASLNIQRCQVLFDVRAEVLLDADHATQREYEDGTRNYTPREDAVELSVVG